LLLLAAEFLPPPEMDPNGGGNGKNEKIRPHFIRELREFSRMILIQF
jgi:hypothetical protein